MLTLPALAHEADDHQVSVRDTFYTPERIAVKPGQKVTWENPGSQSAHNVVFADGSYRMPSPPTLGPWTAERTFDTEGTYRYSCEIHGAEGMTGIVYVNASGTLPPVASFTVSPSPARVGQTVTFDGSASHGASLTKYEWDLDGNGSFETDTGTTPTVSRSYPAAQGLTVRLRVTDDLGRTDQTDKALRIDAASQQEPDGGGSPEGGDSPGSSGPTDDDPAADTLSREVRILSSKQLGRILRRGVRFEAAAPVTGATLRATLTVKGRKVGSVRAKELLRGRIQVMLKLSRRGKAHLRRLVARGRRVKAVLTVTVGGETERARFTIRR
jgi:plastocyanin